MSIRLAIKSLPLGKQLNFRERGGAKRLTCQSESTEKIESGAERSGFGTEEEFTYILTTQILLFQLRASRVYLLIVIAMFSWSNDQIFCKKLMKSLCVNQATSNLKGLSVRAGAGIHSRSIKIGWWSECVFCVLVRSLLQVLSSRRKEKPNGKRKQRIKERRVHGWP